MKLMKARYMKNSRFVENPVPVNLIDYEKYVKLIKKYLMNNARIILHKVTRYPRSSLSPSPSLSREGR